MTVNPIWDLNFLVFDSLKILKSVFDLSYINLICYYVYIGFMIWTISGD